MTIDDLRGRLAAIEADLDAHRYRPGPWEDFLWRARRRPRSERCALARDVSRVSRKLHDRHHPRTSTVAAGVGLELLATSAGGAALAIAIAVGSSIAAVLAAAAWITTGQPLVKLLVGSLLGIRYDYAYLRGIEPRFKMRFGSYLAAPRWARIVLHLSGTAGAPLAAWLVASLVRPHLAGAATVCRAAFWITLVLNALFVLAGLIGLRRIGSLRFSTTSGGAAALELRETVIEGVRNDRTYDAEPTNPREFAESFDRSYTRFATLYDAAVKALPVWKTWLRHALPHIRGPRVLEISFGTGYLLTCYASCFETHGIDCNEAMVRMARGNLTAARRRAHLCRALVECLPYADQSFDSIVNTMAFSGYPDARQALAEMRRVLRQKGRIVLIDVNYPADGNWAGTLLVNWSKRSGDLVRDLGRLLREFGFEFSDEAIGGWGSIHMYVAEKVP